MSKREPLQVLNVYQVLTVIFSKFEVKHEHMNLESAAQFNADPMDPDKVRNHLVIEGNFFKSGPRQYFGWGLIWLFWICRYRMQQQ
jgi:hypothetical protein